MITEILHTLPFANKVLTFVYSFLGFGSVLLGQKIVMFFLKIGKAYFLSKKSENTEVSSMPKEFNQVSETSASHKASKKSVKKNINPFLKTLSIAIISLYLVHQYIFLIILYFQDLKLFYVENDKFLDFLTTWAGISLAYHFFTKADAFFAEKAAYKRK